MLYKKKRKKNKSDVYLRFLINMVSSFSPPLLDLTDDDDDDHEIEQNIHYGSSLTPITNENLPRKKRKLTNTNVCINPSIINWSKRQRNDHYQYQPITHNSIHHQPGTIDINPDDYSFGDQQSHSFHAFDWTTDLRAPPRIYSNPIQTASRVSMVPPLPPNAMNVVKHHLDQSDTVPLISLPPQNDRYMQHSQRKSSNIPIPTIPPQALPLPLPTPTSSLIRPHAQRLPPGKNIRIPYIHTVSLNFLLFFSIYNLFHTKIIPRNPGSDQYDLNRCLSLDSFNSVRISQVNQYTNKIKRTFTSPTRYKSRDFFLSVM